MSDAQTIAIVLGIVVVVAIIKNRSIAGKLGQISLTLDAVHTATNDRDKGQPTLSVEVAQIAKGFGEHRQKLAERFDRFDERFDRLEARLDLLAGRVDVLEHPTDPDRPDPDTDPPTTIRRIL